MKKRLFHASIAAIWVVVQIPLELHGQGKFTPEDIGQTVNGFQDDFTAAARNPDWVPVPADKDNYEQIDGLLRVTVVGDNPGLDTHLLYQAAGYSNATHEVLARIRVTAFGPGDAARCGISVAVDENSSQGINLHFRDQTQDGLVGRQFKLLDDRRAWGPRGLDLKWEDNTWYWLRLRQTGSGTEPGNNISAKVWPGDGSVPEPGDWQMNWRRTGRVGFAGIVGSSIGGLSEFEVDYILIKAQGLPSIKAGLKAFADPLFLNIKQAPENVSADVGQTATFNVEAVGSLPITYQWQKASAGSTNFVDIPGATTKSYTTPALTRTDHGAMFRCVVSVAGATLASKEAVLTVDVTPPSLVAAMGSVNRVLDGVTLIFSEPVTAITATNLANYTVSGASISSVALAADGASVMLKTGPLAASASYIVTANGIQDLVGNRILANSQIAVSLVPKLPSDFGQSVSGFQDDFISAARDPNWTPVPPEKDMYEQIDGLLRVTVLGDSPGLDTHLLYQAPGYDAEAQEVLARIRITAFGAGDAPRCGISVAADAESSQGINLHFRDQDQDGVLGRQFKFLDDRRAWGPPGLDINWVNGSWYWLRLRQTSSDTAAGPNIQAKVWSADGTVSEPADWQMTWSRAGRLGFAGIVGSSIGGLSEFEVDYILIKAAGLPNIKITSSAFPAAAVVSGLKLEASRSAANLTLTWSGTATLESAAQILGPWSIVTGASSPHAAPITGVTRFYRLRQ
jgi:hypothetical protein